MIPLALLIMFYRKHNGLLRCFNMCSRVYHALKIELKFSDIKSSLAIYFIHQALIIINVILTYFVLMKPTVESFILYIMVIQSSNVALHVILLATFFNNFIFIILRKSFQNDSDEQIKETLMIVNSLVKSFQLAYGNVLTISFVQMIIIYLMLVRNE